MIKVLAVDKKKRIEYLEKMIPKASAAYYNTGKAIMTDAEFDALVDELRELKPNSPVLKQIGAPITKAKVELPYHMGSLDKIKPESGAVASWASVNKGPYIISDKLDGVSILLVYGDTVKAYTRGNGTYGQDISYLVPYMNIPKKAPGIKAIRGEIILSESTFNKYYAGEFENARNMVAGLTNRKDIHKAFQKKHVDVVVYEVIDPFGVPSQCLAKLKKLGFQVVPHKVVDSVDDATLSKFLTIRKAKSPYAIDGLVVMTDRKHQRNTSGNPDYGRAFKMTTADAIVETKVVQVHWNPSKHGYLKPQVQIQPVRLAGVTVNFATGFNAKFIKDNKIGPGAIIKITRSGDVIPHILETVKPAKQPQMPTGDLAEYEWTGADIKLKDGVEHDVVKIKRLTEFFRIMGIENFKGGMVARFMDDGLDSIIKILKASKKRFMQVEGIGETMATKLYNNIHEAIEDAYLPNVMYASQIFGRNIGINRLISIYEAYPDILDMAGWPQRKLLAAIVDLPGFNTTTADPVAENLKKFVAWLAKTPITIGEPEEVEVVSNKLKGKVVVFTGFRDQELEQLIITNGGELGGSVNKDTTILLAKDPNGGSSKLQKARDMGVQVMDGQTFRKKFKL